MNPISRLMIAAFATAVLPQVAAGQDPAPTPQVRPLPVSQDAEATTPGALYCRSVADAVADARYARQVAALSELEERLSQRIAELEDKRADFEEWVRQREEMLSRADDSVIAIYSQMRPDAASEQIAIMEADAAAAILAKVEPRTASAILNEMKPETAAHLTNVMAGRGEPDKTDEG